MTHPFPTGLPFATAFYLTLYLLTWALHWAFMHYVAAGCFWLLGGAVEEAVLGGEAWRRPAARTLLSWLPFMLSAAITAGVAPLLFMQILYGVPFYTANLLLNWVWMLIVPALIALFYLMYLLQAWRDREGFAWVRLVLAVAAVGCVLLVGGLWSTNHLLANTAVTNWTAVYAGSASPFDWPSILARGMVWVGFAFPGMAMIVGWQWLGQSAEDEPASTRPLALAALAGLCLLCGGLAAVDHHLSPAAHDAVIGPFAAPYLYGLGGGMLLAALGWLWLAVTGRWHWLPLAAATAGYVAALLSLAVVREAVRLAALGYEQFQAVHERAAEVQGFGTFVAFALLNATLIAFSIWLVARNAGERLPEPEPAREPEPRTNEAPAG